MQESSLPLVGRRMLRVNVRIKLSDVHLIGFALYGLKSAQFTAMDFLELMLFPKLFDPVNVHGFSSVGFWLFFVWSGGDSIPLAPPSLHQMVGRLLHRSCCSSDFSWKQMWMLSALGMGDQAAGMREGHAPVERGNEDTAQNTMHRERDECTCFAMRV